MKEIKGYEGLYSIRQDGTVINTVTGKERAATINSCGYPTISLYKNGKRKTFKVHRLVALHYLKKPRKKNVVNHIDGNKANPHATNLEWVNQSENMKHALEKSLLVHTRCSSTGRFVSAN